MSGDIVKERIDADVKYVLINVIGELTKRFNAVNAATDQKRQDPKRDIRDVAHLEGVSEGVLQSIKIVDMVANSFKIDLAQSNDGGT